MITDETVIDLIFRFKPTLDSREKHLKSFCKQGVQVESWLKGELLCFLDEEEQAGRIAGFYHEVTLYRKKVDLGIKTSSRFDEEEAHIELKHWLIGYQGKQNKYRLNANFYFCDRTHVGIKPDVEKLSDVSDKAKFLLILTTANPGAEDWTAGVNKFNERFSPLHIESLTNPAEFPTFYYLGCLKVSKEVAH